MLDGNNHVIEQFSFFFSLKEGSCTIVVTTQFFPQKFHGSLAMLMVSNYG